MQKTVIGCKNSCSLKRGKKKKLVVPMHVVNFEELRVVHDMFNGLARNRTVQGCFVHSILIVGRLKFPVYPCQKREMYILI